MASGLRRCGSQPERAGPAARHGISAGARDERLPGTIVTTSGGCSAHLADVIGRDRVQEMSEYLAAAKDGPRGVVTVDGRRARVALQDSIHLVEMLAVAEASAQAEEQVVPPVR